MRARLLFLLFLSLAGGAVLVAFIFAVRDWAAQGEANQAIMQHDARRRRLEAEVRAGEQRVSASQREQGELQTRLEAARKKLATAPKSESPRPASPASAQASTLREALLNDPHL